MENIQECGIISSNMNLYKSGEKECESMDIKDYEKILHAMPAAGVFIIREDDHRILYYNDRMREVAPHVKKGIPCHELGGSSCKNCPLLTIGNRIENRTLSYNSPFGELVDIVAVRMQWENQIPAFIITVTPHMQVINYTYYKILRVNLTTDHYDMVKAAPEEREIGQGTDRFSVWLGQLIYNGGIHPDDMNGFINFTRLNSMRSALDAGEKMLTCSYRRNTGDGFRWRMMEIIPDSEYTKNNQTVFLYIKDMDDIMRESLEIDESSIRIQEIIRTLGEQNYSVYTIDLDTGESNLVRENGHTQAGWKFRTFEWEEVINSRLIRQIHYSNREEFQEKFSLEGLRRAKDTEVQKTDMLCQWRSDEDFDYRYMAVIAYFGQSHGSKNYTIVAFQNVDKRVRQELALSQRDMQLAAILKSRYSVMTTIHLENGQCERIWINKNSTMKKTVTENYNQYFQKTMSTIVFPEDAEAFQNVMSPEQLYRKAASTQDYLEEVCQYRVAGTPLRWMEQHVIYSRQENHMSVNILGRDITREKLQEEQRLKEEQEYENIIRTLGSMFFATYYVDLDEGVLRSVTQLKEVEKVLGDRMNYMDGLRLYAERFIHPEDREEYISVLSTENLKKTLSNKHPYVTLAYRKIPDKPNPGPEEYGWIRGTAVMAEAGSDGKASIVIYAAQDVTDSKRKEMREQQAIQAACEAADFANASKSDFLSCMSHNVRTPMNGIIGMLAIASSHVEDSEKVRECLDKAYTASGQLLTILNELLDISRIKSGTAKLESGAFSLSGLMQDVTDTILPDVERKGLHMKVYPMQVRHDKVIGDSKRLQQVFLYILRNSVKFTSQGGVLEVSVREQESRGYGCSSYDFMFCDNGIGMDETFIQHVFEPFTRAEDPRVSKVEGTGLGLTIAQNIVRMMGGSIGVKSTPGAGSQFTVTVILRQQNPSEPLKDTPASEQEAASESSFENCRILLIEDNELNQEIAMELIGEIGAKVECVSDGRKGLVRFADMPEGYYDLIFMDIQMPVMDGYAATRAIRKLPRADASTIPIIAMSANNSAEDIAASRQSGMNEHISKPLDIPHLVSRMEYWLNRTQ
ncbi:MAG TPA: hypothetical protein DD414_01775 [Lachnospiraceae bacterium]|nr:hypothetical protein [Lachnospiraceae bacterium]